MPQNKDLKRISLMIREDQYDILNKKGINLSGLVRDLLDDYVSDHKITVTVSEETKDIYNLVVSNTGSSDEELEPFLKKALGELLNERIKSMQSLAKKAFPGK